jgi:hypothetical protein
LPVLPAQLGVFARNHRKLLVVENDLTVGGVAPDSDRRLLKSLLGHLLPAAFFG